MLCTRLSHSSTTRFGFLTALLLSNWVVSAATVNVDDFGASGDDGFLTCSTQAGTRTLKCEGGTQISFKNGHGVVVRAAGGLPHAGVLPVLPAPNVDRAGSDASTGTNTYCYRVTVADPLGGIQPPSPPKCLFNQPSVSSAVIHKFYLQQGFHEYAKQSNLLRIDPGRIVPIYLWYSSVNGADYRLMAVSNGHDPRPNYVNTSEAQRPNKDFGGWPETLPFETSQSVTRQDHFSTITDIGWDRNQLIVTLADTIPASVNSTQLLHDDTQAVQRAIDAVAQLGGGIVKFPPKRYRLERPTFPTGNRATPYTTDFLNGPKFLWWTSAHLLHPDATNPNNLTLEGTRLPDGQTTLINVGRSFGGGNGVLLYTRTPEMTKTGNPGYIADVRPIDPVDKGAMTIQLQNLDQTQDLAPGDDVWLYSGVFHTPFPTDSDFKPCTNALNTQGQKYSGGGCHFSELNTIASVDVGSGQATLVYPISKKYWDDGYDSFGMTRLPKLPHGITIKDLDLIGQKPVLSTDSAAFDVTIDGIRMHSVGAENYLGSGYKRGLTIKNSTLHLGTGLQGWGGTTELDQVTDVTVVNNHVTGYAAPGAESPSAGARLYFTEGSNNVQIRDNTFKNFQVSFQEANDVFVSNNAFIDSVVWVGTTQRTPFNSANRWSYLSYASQHTASISHNSFSISPSYRPGWVVKVGNFSDASITDNTFKYFSNYPHSWAISTASGVVARNQIEVQTPVSKPAPIEVVTDVNAKPVIIKDNQLIAQTPWSVSIYEPFAPAVNICITGNDLNGIATNQPHTSSRYFSGYNFLASCDLMQ